MAELNEATRLAAANAKLRREVAAMEERLPTLVRYAGPVPRSVAEFEPMAGVLIDFPLDIPYELVAEFSEDDVVYTLVRDQAEEDQAAAAFVNYGVDKHGFLPLKEVSPGAVFSDDPNLSRQKIKELLKEGQEIIVQIEKELARRTIDDIRLPCHGELRSRTFLGHSYNWLNEFQRHWEHNGVRPFVRYFF